MQCPVARNLKEYRAFKARGAEILDIPEDEIESEDDDLNGEIE